MNRAVDKVQIRKCREKECTETLDIVVVEEPMEIRIGFGPRDNRKQRNLAVTMRTPGNDFELAVGFLRSERIINTYSDIAHISCCTDVKGGENIVRVELIPELVVETGLNENRFLSSSSCGICGKENIESLMLELTIPGNGIAINHKVLKKIGTTFRQGQTVFEHTGGTHAAGLFDLDGNMKIIREDVGRHNAVDKVIGATMASKNNNLDDKIMMVSGRIGFELVQKCMIAGIPGMVAIGAPTNLAVNLAKKSNMLLIGFLVKDGYNIYHGEVV